MLVQNAQNRGILNAFSHQEIIKFFMEQGKVQTYAKNLTLYSSGEASTMIYYIDHGEVKISRSTNDGKEVALGILGKGDVFGEAEVLQGSPRGNTAIVQTDSVIYGIAREILLEKMRQNPRLMFWMLNKMTQKSLETEDLLIFLKFKSAEAKIASLLLKLGKMHGVRDEKGILIDHPITHQEIGNLIATTRETVSYAFMEFRKLGLLSSAKRRTLILNEEGLQRIAEGD